MKNWRALLFVTAELLMLAGVFYFWIQSENDHFNVTTQKVFPWIAGLCGVLFIGGIYWFGSSRKKW